MSIYGNKEEERDSFPVEGVESRVLCPYMVIRRRRGIAFRGGSRIEGCYPLITIYGHMCYK